MKLNIKTKQLYKAILNLQTENECQKFFRDLLTEAEIKEFSNRWRVAQMLNEKVAYELITQETGMSSTTIARTNKWLTDGMGGYKLMLKRLKDMNHHHSPLVAE